MTIDRYIFQGQQLARNLSRNQREVLMDHIDGSRQITVRNHLRHMTVLSLVKIHVLTIPMPQATRSAITDLGRATLAAVLAQYAESLVMAARGHDTKHYAVAPWLETLTKSLADTTTPDNGTQT